MRNIVIAAILLLSAGSPAQAETHGGMSKGSEEIHQVMMKHAKEATKTKLSGDVDKDFATMMADHHRSGIEMAKAQLEHGKDRELKELARKMIESQKDEIRVLENHKG
ncbi:MAG: DUF305 domain-containing protein [Gemmataceae bacterium]